MRGMILVGACAAVLGASGASLRAQCPEGWVYGPDQGYPGIAGQVYDTTLWDPDGAGPDQPVLIAAGFFSAAGTTRARSLAAWDGSQWHEVGGGLDGGSFGPQALLVHQDHLVIGGDFTIAGGQAVGRIASWDGHAWNSLGGGVNNVVLALTVFNGDLIAAGRFTMAGGNAANRIARWDGSAWQAMGAGMDGNVSALAVFNGELVAGGAFTSAGGMPANRVARWDGAQWRAMGGGVEGFYWFLCAVFAFVEHGGDLYAGGEFLIADGVPATRLARWDGAGWHPLGDGSGPDNRVFSLGSHAGDLLVGGVFSSGPVVGSAWLARWTSQSWQPFDAGLNGRPNAIDSYGDTLVVAGQFTSAGGEPVSNIARRDPSGWSAFGRGNSARFDELLVYDGEFLAAGEADTRGSVRACYVHRWNGVAWDVVGPGMDRGIRHLGTYGGDLIVGGAFGMAGVVPALGIAAWDGAEWRPLGDGVNAIVYDSLEMDGQLIVAGAFTTAGEITTTGIASWDGQTWAALGGGVSGSPPNTTPFVYKLARYNGELIAAGSFTRAGGVVVNNIARWNGSAWQPIAGGVGGGSSQTMVFAMALYNGDLVVGGNFTTAGGQPANMVARWNGASWSPLGAGFTGSLNSGVRALLPYGDGLIAAGAFNSPSGATNIAVWDGTSWRAMGAGVDSFAMSLAQYGNELVVGGWFVNAGGRPSPHLARWSATGAPWVAINPVPQQVGCGGTTVFTAAAADGYEGVAYQWRRFGSGGPVDLVDGPTPWGSSITGAATGTLTISGTHADDAGEYPCLISNDCGSVESNGLALIFCRPDFNCDGALNSQDFFDFLGAFFGGNGDFNGDSATTSADFFDYLAAFFAGC